MTDNTENPIWGEEPAPRQSPAPEGNGWSGRKTLAAVAVAVGIAAAGGGVIWAAGGTDAQMGGPRGYGMIGGPGLRQMGPLFGDTQHGEFQVGEVTEVSDSSISVRSADGYTKTYTVDSETLIGAMGGEPMRDRDISDIAKGDTVTVVASTDDSGKSTAEAITERDASGHQRRGGPWNGQQAPPTR
ncbi:hypothetical protein [Saccharothrix coeruleofusca]|uniref:DUF5666 domain-containing protein n=1 Tax=Saccharothrix coeruleofusca TaxID=33919 RepID=A0A918AR04_9PSEU|nr:hypothetical protein [Saccharothrix coeruleofusca]GGP71625.1 hypothetical protein GCM10010185_50960 [Saccharothrix coeruleofusca]